VVVAAGADDAGSGISTADAVGGAVEHAGRGVAVGNVERIAAAASIHVVCRTGLAVWHVADHAGAVEEGERGLAGGTSSVGVASGAGGGAEVAVVVDVVVAGGAGLADIVVGAGEAVGHVAGNAAGEVADADGGNEAGGADSADFICLAADTVGHIADNAAVSVSARAVVIHALTALGLVVADDASDDVALQHALSAAEDIAGGALVAFSCVEVALSICAVGHSAVAGVVVEDGS
jgi:hypothetical protein